MKKAIALTGILFIFLALFCFVQPATAESGKKDTAPRENSGQTVLRIRDRQVISFEQMIMEISCADIIFLGENHDSAADHMTELAVIRALHASGASFALGLEMFRADSQKELDAWVQGDLPLDGFRMIYYDNWGLPWRLYRDIFLFVRQARIPAVGLNVPAEISDQVFEHGFDSLSPSEKKDLPSGITCTVDAEYMRYIRQMYRFHTEMGGQNKKSFYNFCQAQMLWDSAMARNIAARLEKTPGIKMVVLTGIGHAWKRGIPEQIKKISNYSYVVVLPGLPNGKADRDITTDDADYILMGTR